MSINWKLIYPGLIRFWFVIKTSTSWLSRLKLLHVLGVHPTHPRRSLHDNLRSYWHSPINPLGIRDRQPNAAVRIGLLPQCLGFRLDIVAVSIGWHRVEKVDSMAFPWCPITSAFLRVLIIEEVTAFLLNMESSFRSGVIPTGRSIHCVQDPIIGTHHINSLSADWDPQIAIICPRNGRVRPRFRRVAPVHDLGLTDHARFMTRLSGVGTPCCDQHQRYRQYYLQQFLHCIQSPALKYLLEYITTGFWHDLFCSTFSNP